MRTVLSTATGDESDMANTFDDLSDVYEAMIDWPKRLAHEGPFFRRHFAAAQVARVLDCACGSGHHAALFHGWGLQVEGADLSPSMIELARARHGEPAGLTWRVRGFDQPVAGDRFDAVACLGNSLALAPDEAVAAAALARMLAAVRPGGLVIVHLLNLWRLADGPCLWQKCFRTARTGGEVLVTKGVHRSGNRGFVDLLVATLDQPPRLTSESATLLGFEAEWLAATARQSGATQVDCYGGYSDEPYRRDASIDLIVVARR